MENTNDPQGVATKDEIDRHLVMQIISDTTDLTYRAAMELAERIVQELKPDEELDDFEYYGRYGYSRTAPTCDGDLDD